MKAPNANEIMEKVDLSDISDGKWHDMATLENSLTVLKTNDMLSIR